MPVRLIPNQLVKLYDTETLNQKNKRVTQDYRTYCQVVREEQTTMFQVELLPDSDNLITNGDFTDDISSWNVLTPMWQWASGRLQGIRATTQAGIYQQVTTVVGRVYKITATVDFQNTTSTLTIVANQGTTPTWVYTAADYGLDPFTIEVYFTADLTTVEIEFYLQGNEKDVIYLDEIAVERMSLSTATLEDCNGNVIETISAYAQAGKYITYSVDWFGKAEGCYRICLTGTEDTDSNYLDYALAIGTEGGAAIELEQGGFLKWYG